MKLKIVNRGLTSSGDLEATDLYIDGICATLAIITGPGALNNFDGIEGANFTPLAGTGPLTIHWPPVYVDGRPVPYDQRVRYVGKLSGVLSITYLIP